MFAARAVSDIQISQRVFCLTANLTDEGTAVPKRMTL